MFKIVASPRAWWPVVFAGVTEEGAIIENRFQMRFALLDEDAHQALMVEARDLLTRDGEDADGAALLFSQIAADFVVRIAEDWREVVIDNGTKEGDPLPWSRENLPIVLRQPNVFRAVISAYRDCRDGREAIRSGN